MHRLRTMTGAAVAGRRLVAWLRGLPRGLYDDLWALPVDPVPAVGRPGAPVWRPVFGMLLALGAGAVALFHVYDLIPHGVGIPAYAVLLAVAQSAALIAGMSLPLYAWWVSLALMLVSVRLAEPALAHHELFPTVPEIALQAGALFLLALRVHPRRAVTALVISLFAVAFSVSFTTQAHDHALDRASSPPSPRW